MKAADAKADTITSTLGRIEGFLANPAPPQRHQPYPPMEVPPRRHQRRDDHRFDPRPRHFVGICRPPSGSGGGGTAVSTCGGSVAGGSTTGESIAPSAASVDSEVREDEEARAALARAEAEAATRRRPGAAYTESTPAESFGHLPVPLLQALSRVTTWTLTLDVHDSFLVYCSTVRNQKAKEATALFAGEGSIGYTNSWTALQKCKNITQWKARALSQGLPSEAVLVVRNMGDIGGLLVLGFLHNSQPGNAIAADLKSRESFIQADIELYLSQS